jgi:ABC-2 type transport system permease protein
MVGFPAEVALGRLPPERVLAGIGAQLVWVACTGLVLALVWRTAVRRYSAVGQ